MSGRQPDRRAGNVLAACVIGTLAAVYPRELTVDELHDILAAMLPDFVTPDRRQLQGIVVKFHAHGQISTLTERSNRWTGGRTRYAANAKTVKAALPLIDMMIGFASWYVEHAESVEQDAADAA